MKSRLGTVVTAPVLLIGALLLALPILVGGAAACPPASGAGLQSGSGISIASWNICAASCGGWQARSKDVTREVARYMPDIVAVQEGGWGKTKRGYTFAGFKSIGYVTGNQQEPFIGRYVFYKPDKFDLVKADSFGLGGTHGMSWTTLRPKGGGAQLTVVDVHLTFEKSADAQRKEQMTTGMAKVRKQAGPDAGPIVYVGDFNSNDSRAYDAPADVMKDAGYVDARTVATAKVNDDVNSARERAVDAPIERNGHQTDHIYVPKTGAQVDQWQQFVNGTKTNYVAPFMTDHNMIGATISLGAAPVPTPAPGASGTPTPTPTPAPTSPAPTMTPSAAPTNAAPAGVVDQVGKFDDEQVKNAAAIIAAGKKLGIPERGQVIALMTAIGESTLRVVDHGDAAGPDSRGLFQQRDSWGSYADRMDPAASAGLFYAALTKVDGWEQLEPTAAAHRVQRNADPNHYAKYWADATKLYAQISGSDLEQIAATTSTGCATGDTTQVSFGTTADCDFQGYTNPRSCTEALAAAAKIAAESPCTSDLPGGTWKRWCLAFVAKAYGRSSAGYHTAMDMYRDMNSRGLISTSKDIPAGALVFFSSSSAAGHVALYNGNGMAWSNDYVRSGCIDLTPMSKMGAGGRYLGWSPPAFPGAA